MSIYLDYNATTPVDNSVLEAMLPYLREDYGNPSSRHSFGRRAQAALDTARQQLADLVGAHPSQVIFTSGGTEANNLALKGAAPDCQVKRLIVGATEHPSVAKVADALADQGWQVDIVGVERSGVVNQTQLAKLMESPPGMLSIMYANNETGVIQPIAEIAAMARACGAIVHTDAIQAVGKIEIDFNEMGAHLMTVSGHKIGAPKGVGALIVDKALSLTPLLHGGGHEKGRRGGTENVPGIVGLGAAAVLVKERLAEDSLRILGLRGRLESGLRALGRVEIFAENAPRLPNTVNFSVPGIDGETLLMGLDRAGFAVSSGSACSSERSDPSPVLLAMGIDQDKARGAIRVSLGHNNSASDIDQFVTALGAQLVQMREFVATVAS